LYRKGIEAALRKRSGGAFSAAGFLPCRAQKSPLLRRFAVFGIGNGTDPRMIVISTDLFYFSFILC
jgi:hypothetical protein